MCWRGTALGSFVRFETAQLRTMIVDSATRGENSKRAGSSSDINRAQSSAGLSSESIRVDGRKHRARTGHATFARDCAPARTCDRSSDTRRLLSDADIVNCSVSTS